MGTSWEDSIEGGERAGRFDEVLLRGDTGGVFVWGRGLDVVSANGTESRGSSCGVHETDELVEGKNSEQRLVAEVVGAQSASWSRDTTATDPHGQKTGYSGVMGGLTAYI